MKRKTTALVLRTIADEKSMQLFLFIATSQGGIRGDTLKKQAKVTRKQFYSKLARIKESGLVVKKGGKYALTTFGRIVYEAQKKVEVALADFWKLRAMDMLESSELDEEELRKIKDSLLKKGDQ